MGVYIKGAELPKGCYECPLMDGEYGDCKVGATGLYAPYMEDCPLIEVPEPHGRLIDAEAFYEYVTNQVGGVDCGTLLNNEITPTVIEGSEE